MKVIERANKTDYQFLVRKPFFFDGREVKPGELLTLKDDVDVLGAVLRGKLLPTDLSDGQVYVALRSILLPGQSKKFECKPLDLISLTAIDGLKLMLEKRALPLDSTRWRPYKMRLGRLKQGQDLKKRDELTAAQKEVVMQKFLLENADLPSQKKKK